ncbi:MAG: DEAD/DEAH box helicase [Planctomycetes bacterium]|nr:DEAD/DEAH box helicase [Planctomycetota bacterium]
MAEVVGTNRDAPDSVEDLYRTATGHSPFPFQLALATGPSIPEVLVAPTGAGKTAAAVLGWLWRRRFAGAAVRRETPRRLVFCLPMRTLVEQTAAAITAWLERVGLAHQVPVSVLMGGSVPADWDESPEADQVLVGTQDQLLSRALMRGYGMGRARWPMHFAFLNDDVLWVIDETQLLGPGLSTSAQLDAFRSTWRTFGPNHTLWMSATLDLGSLRTVDRRGRDFRVLRTGPADEAEPTLRRRMYAPKPLARATTVVPRKGDASRALAAEILGAHRAGTRTLVVVNRVSRAQNVYEELRKAVRRGGPQVAVLHSRFRPMDRQAIQAQVLSSGWSGVLVSTQVVEAGVDVDSATLFTELSPWSSMVQRFGRCNRRGDYSATEAAVHWIDIEDDDATALPYAAADLERSRQKLIALADASPDSLRSPAEEEARPASPVLRSKDLLDLFDTTPDLTGHDLDVSPYVRSVGDTDVLVAWRCWDGEVPPSDMAPLGRDELCAVGIGPFRAFQKQLSGQSMYRWDFLSGAWIRCRRPEEIVPGHVVLLAADIGGYEFDAATLAGCGFDGDPKHRPSDIASPAVSTEDASDRDPLAFGGYSTWITLEQHSQDAADAADGLVRSLQLDLPGETLRTAARWHDAGKAHEGFQEAVRP